jgi:hypothetical protein
MEKQDAPDSQLTPKTVMLGPAVQDRPLLRDRKANGIRRRGLASVMNCLCARVEHDLPSFIPTAPAPIHVIAIHKQTFIQ